MKRFDEGRLFDGLPTMAHAYDKDGFLDVFRQRIADARTEEQVKAQKLIEAERQKAVRAETEKLRTARKLVSDGVISIRNAVSYFGCSKEQILAR